MNSRNNTVEEFDIMSDQVYNALNGIATQTHTCFLTRLFQNKMYKNITSIVCFILFLCGFLWSIIHTPVSTPIIIDSQIKAANHHPTILIIHTFNDKTSITMLNQTFTENLAAFLEKFKSCPSYYGNEWLPFCDRAIPMNADTYLCCDEANRIKSLNIASAELNAHAASLLINFFETKG